ncbi:hypothetical protein, partial [Methanothrix sp.]|uniref:hypothetical protein n=1 Tax=Methanothrix sp. TaxID=90426 RepID=UPI003C75584B
MPGACLQGANAQRKIIWRTNVNGNLKILNSGKVKFPTCKFLRSILRSYVDANREGVPHVER